MHHDIGHKFGKRALDQWSIDDAAFNLREARMTRQIVASPGGEIVDRQNRVTAGKQQIGHGRADLAAAAGNQHFHWLSSYS